MTANIANLKPPIVPGERRGGRVPGQLNRTTRALKLALFEAAETSKHCPADDQTLRRYCKFLADEHPNVFANLLGKMIPQQLKAEITSAPPRRLTPDMDLPTMIATFEEQIKNPAYRPKVIDHDDTNDDGDD